MYKFTFMRNKVEIMKKKSHRYPFFLTLRQKLASMQKHQNIKLAPMGTYSNKPSKPS